MTGEVMKVTDRVTQERLSADEAYERFFDGFYNLGRPSEVFERTVVLAAPRRISRRGLRRGASARRRGRKRLASE
jgi:hypothetical protein